MSKPALFFDLDSSLIVTLSGDTFPRTIDDWRLNGHVIAGIEQYAAQGWPLIIVTNQGGIEAKFWTAAQIEQKLISVQKWAKMYIEGLQTAAYYCSSMKASDPDRKPNPGMMLRAAKDLDLDLAASLMVGDMESDRQAAQAAGISYMDITEFLRTHPATVEQLRYTKAL